VAWLNYAAVAATCIFFRGPVYLAWGINSQNCVLLFVMMGIEWGKTNQDPITFFSPPKIVSFYIA